MARVHDRTSPRVVSLGEFFPVEERRVELGPLRCPCRPVLGRLRHHGCNASVSRRDLQVLGPVQRRVTCFILVAHVCCLLVALTIDLLSSLSGRLILLFL